MVRPGVRWRDGSNGKPQALRMPPPARRETLPDHLVPAGLAAPAAWRPSPLRYPSATVDMVGAQTHAVDCHCDEGEMVPEHPWEGVAVAAIVGRAGVQPEARFLTVYAGHCTGCVPLEEALTGGALLARRLNGQPLTPEPGAPLWLVAARRAGFSKVKWGDGLAVLAAETATTGESRARARLLR